MSGSIRAYYCIILSLYVFCFFPLFLPFLGRCLFIQKYFCTVYDYEGIADLSMGYWNPKRKLEIAEHF